LQIKITSQIIKLQANLLGISKLDFGFVFVLMKREKTNS